MPVAIAALAVVVSACVTSPKQTVMYLDTTDKKWTSKSCVAARKEVYEWHDQNRLRTAVGVAGNMVAPFAGTGANVAIGASQRHKRKELNQQVLSACVSDPQQDARARASGGPLKRLLGKIGQ